MTTLELDLKGLKCPLPALRLRKALHAMASGDSRLVTCTDPLSVIDIPALLRETGDELVEQRREGETLTFLVRKT